MSLSVPSVSPVEERSAVLYCGLCTKGRACSSTLDVKGYQLFSLDSAKKLGALLCFLLLAMQQGGAHILILARLFHFAHSTYREPSHVEM
jgi:hypothetical protein